MATFSKRTLRILGDVLTDFSTLTPIGHLFEDNGISPPPEVAEEAVQGVNGQRRGLTAQYVASLDLSDPADRRTGGSCCAFSTTCSPTFCRARVTRTATGPARSCCGR